MLLLSLRCLGLVFEDLRNLALGLAVRGMDWSQTNAVLVWHSRECVRVACCLLSGLGKLPYSSPLLDSCLILATCAGTGTSSQAAVQQTHPAQRKHGTLASSKGVH